MPRVRVFVADDHPLVLERLVSLLKDRFEVVGTATNGRLLLEGVARFRPDVVVTDISMPGLNGIEALRRLKTDRAETKVIVLTVDADTDVAVHAIRLGASGFMTKASAFDELATAIDEVLQGRIYVTHAADSDVVLPDGSQPAGRSRG